MERKEILSILFNDMYFQVVKIYGVDEIVPVESDLVESFEIFNVGIQPDRTGKIPLMTHSFYGLKYLARAV